MRANLNLSRISETELQGATLRRHFRWLIVIALGILLPNGGQAGSETYQAGLAQGGYSAAQNPEGGHMKLTSQAFSPGGPIPKRFTCEGQDISPELSWTNAPKEAKSFALILHDPDAPKKGGFTHWVVYNIPAGVNHIPENVTHNADVPGIGFQGINDSGKIGYMGPCPPSGTHRYFARLYALRSELQLGPNATYAQVLEAMRDKIIEEAELMGTYAKTGAKAA